MVNRNGRRVVITGLGAVAPNGIGKEEFWAGLKAGKNCIDRVSFFDPSNHPSQVAAEIRNFDLNNYITREERHDEIENVFQRTCRSAQLAIVSTKFALEDAGLPITDENRNKIGIIMGTGAAGIPYAEKEMEKYYKGGLKKMQPFTSIASFAGAMTSNIALQFGIKGFNIVVSNGCTASNDAMGIAMDRIRAGRNDIILTGGADACVTPIILAAFCRIKAVSMARNNDPTKACRPFCKSRDGFVLSEGAWTLVFEELEHALKRGATIYAEVAGYGSTCDAHHMTCPLPTAQETANAMLEAIKDGGMSVDEVDYVNAHGTSTPLNDKFETLAIKKVFGERAYKIPVTSLKSQIGHAVGAAGAGAAVSTALSLKYGFLPATINYEDPDPECDLDYVPNIGREKSINAAIVNSIGFGSKNASLLLKKYS